MITSLFAQAVSTNNEEIFISFKPGVVLYTEHIVLHVF